MLELGRPALKQAHSLLKRETSGQPSNGKSISDQLFQDHICSGNTAKTIVPRSNSTICTATTSATKIVTLPAAKLATRAG